MDFDTYTKYKSQYVDGLKVLRHRAYRWERIKGETNKKDGSPNYDLFFSQTGILLHSLDHNSRSRIIYSYDKNGKLIRSMETSTYDAHLLDISEFKYDDEGRIQWEYSQEFGLWEVQTEINYNYAGNIKKVEMKTNRNFVDEVYYFSILHQNGLELFLEEKGMKVDGEIYFWDKYEYNTAGDLIKQWEADDLGNFKEKPVENPKYHWEDKYEYNDKGLWVGMTTMRNGEAVWDYERQFSFYGHNIYKEYIRNILKSGIWQSYRKPITCIGTKDDLEGKKISWPNEGVRIPDVSLKKIKEILPYEGDFSLKSIGPWLDKFN